MRCVIDLDPAVFLAATDDFRRDHPFFTNAITTNAMSRAMGRMPVAPGTMWLRVVDGGERLCGVAVHTPSRCVLVSPMPADAVLLLAETLADEARSVGRLPGVDGPTEVATAFARGYTGLTSCSWTAGLDQRMLALHRVTPPRAAAGECLAATSRDVDLITAWMSAFTHEAISGQQPPTSGALAQRIDQQPPSIWLWTIDGQPTSLCWQSMPAAGVVRVSAVFTPKHQRGHGYASANVAAVSQRALDAGASACMLYTDRTNPTSNRIYEAIGYEHIGDALECLFTEIVRIR